MRDPPRWDDGGDAELHQRASAWRHDHSRPVERVGLVRPLDAVEWDLRAYDIDEERDGSEHGSLLDGEGNGRFGDCREEPSEGAQ